MGIAVLPMQDMAANDDGEADMVRVLLDAGWPASRVKPAASAGKAAYTDNIALLALGN